MDGCDVDVIAEALDGIASQLKWLGTGDAATTLGAVEAHAVLLKDELRGLSSSVMEAGEGIAKAIESLAASVDMLAGAVKGKQ